MSTKPPVSIKSVSPLLQVADLQYSRKYYTDKLGFIEDWFDGEGFAIMRRGECSVFLAQKQTEVDLRNQTAREATDGYANYDLHFHCETGTIDALWAEYRDAGATMPNVFAEGPINRDYGIRDFSILDPDGYDLVFGAPIKRTPATDVAGYDYTTSPIHRVMVVALNADGETTAYYEFDDEDQLKYFEAMFPGYREFPQSQNNTWGTTKFKIYMCLYAGRTIKIMSDGNVWSVTFGSIPIDGDLDEFITSLKPTLGKSI